LVSGEWPSNDHPRNVNPEIVHCHNVSNVSNVAQQISAAIDAFQATIAMSCDHTSTIGLNPAASIKCWLYPNRKKKNMFGMQKLWKETSKPPQQFVRPL